MTVVASVVVPSYHRSSELSVLLDCLARQTERDFEVIVILQDSPPLAKSEILLKTIQVPHRLGSPEARNIGISESRGEIILSCDDDIIVGPRWIEAACKTMNLSRTTNIGMLAGRVLGISSAVYTSPQLLSAAIEQVEREERLGWSMQPAPPQSRSHNSFNPWTGTFSKQFHVLQRHFAHHAYGCNMAVRRSALHEVGGFDPYWTDAGQFEEAELALRLRSAGMRVLFEPSLVALHCNSQQGGQRVLWPSYRQIFRARYRHYVELFRRHGNSYAWPLFLAARLSEAARWAFGNRSPRLFGEAVLGLVDGFSLPGRLNGDDSTLSE